jgi:mRNA-degrading endonuclease YafQ of YafQ-DinJ toxin-antitoxin module
LAPVTGLKNPAEKPPAFHRNPKLWVDPISENPSDPALKTHKLSGRLRGLWACWVEYDCRIIFAFKQDPAKQEQLILLVDIGTHDEAY